MVEVYNVGWAEIFIVYDIIVEELEILSSNLDANMLVLVNI